MSLIEQLRHSFKEQSIISSVKGNYHRNNGMWTAWPNPGHWTNKKTCLYKLSNTSSRISDIFHVGRRTYLFASWVPYKTAISALFLSAFIDKHANAPLNHMKLVKVFPMSAKRPTKILLFYFISSFLSSNIFPKMHQGLKWKQDQFLTFSQNWLYLCN